MSKRNRNFIIAYVILVGLPIVGLAGVLKSGRTLTAPISVDGLWKVQVDPAQLAALPCGRSLAFMQGATIAISQSGTNFTLTLDSSPKSMGSGAVEGTTLKAAFASSAPWSSEIDCSGRELSLDGAVDLKTNPRTMAGTISLNDCASCVPAQFHAVKQVPPVKGGH